MQHSEWDLIFTQILTYQCLQVTRMVLKAAFKAELKSSEIKQ